MNAALILTDFSKWPEFCPAENEDCAPQQLQCGTSNNTDRVPLHHGQGHTRGGCGVLLLVVFSELDCFEVSVRFIDYQLKQNFLFLTCSCRAVQLPCQCWECLIWEKLMSRVAQQLAVLSSQCKFSLRSVECNWWGWLGGRWTSEPRPNIILRLR